MQHFQGTLTISSSATVTPSADTFKVQFSKGDLEPELGTGGTATLSGTTISKISATFTKPGDDVSYKFYVINTGQYLAYLKSVTFGSKTCTATPGGGATQALVDAACDDITISIAYGVGTSNYRFFSCNDSSITNNSISKGSYLENHLTISYSSSGDRADGPFTVNFDNITFNYASD